MEEHFPSYYRNLFEELLGIDCSTGLEKEIADRLKIHHEAQGYTVFCQEIEASRFNIWAIHPSDETKKRALFSSHIDTVPPHLEWRHHRKEDCYYGRGACDTEGGIIAMLMARDAMPDRAIDFLWVIGEEVDHIGAKKALPFYKSNYSNLNYKMIALCEPTDNQLAVTQKGIAKAKINFIGKNAHSAYPDLGIDANKRMIEFCQFLYDLATSLKDENYGDFDLNIGLIKGGDAANVISAQSEITFLARSNSHHNFFKQQVELFLQEGETIEWITNHQPREFKEAKNLNDKHSFVAKFNTDAAYLSGIAPVFLMGPGYIIHAHSENEHIFVAEILEGTKRYCQLVQDLIE